MKYIFLFWAIPFCFFTSTSVPIKTLIGAGQTSQATKRTDAGKATFSIETKDSSILLADISTAYDMMQKNIDLTFDNLIMQTKNRIDSLNDKIKELNAQIKRLKEQTEKMDILIRQLSVLQPVLIQLQREKQNGIQNLREEKNRALRKATEFLRQRRSQEEIHVYSQIIKNQTARAVQDSLRSINLRYMTRQ